MSKTHRYNGEWHSKTTGKTFSLKYVPGTESYNAIVESSNDEPIAYGRIIVRQHNNGEGKIVDSNIIGNLDLNLVNEDNLYIGDVLYERIIVIDKKTKRKKQFLS